MSDPSTGIDLEVAVTSFERAWQAGQVPDIREFVTRLPGWPELSEAGRLQLICEFVAVDMECQWRTQRESPLTESTESGVWCRDVNHYRDALEELQATPDVPVMLIVEEYRARRLWGDMQNPTDILHRYPARRDELLPELESIESEIAADQSSRKITPPAGGSNTLTAIDPQAPLPYSDFQLQRQIGAGGMGKVYRSLQKSLDRQVAVKFLRRVLLQFPDAISRFIDEAKTVARLRHPGIVGVHGLGRTPGGGYFIVMDLIDGRDLAEVAAAGTVPLADALRWVAEVSEAIAHAHAHSIVHCDLKPSNVLIDTDGQAWVTDFGLARGFDDGFLQPSPEPQGTAAFMAPEQIDQAAGVITERTDVYGLGGLLYATLAGRPPRTGERVADILAETITEAPIRPITSLRPDVPAEIAQLIADCLSWSPADRPPSAAAVAATLRQWLKAYYAFSWSRRTPENS